MHVQFTGINFLELASRVIYVTVVMGSYYGWVYTGIGLSQVINKSEGHRDVSVAAKRRISFLLMSEVRQ